jgi:predicted DNA-binding transcriptional regulator YafY
MAKAERDYIIPPTDNAVFPAMPPARFGALPRTPDDIELLAVIAAAIAAADRADAILATVDHLPVNDQRHATALSQARECMRRITLRWSGRQGRPSRRCLG